jgi:hypothetical protein
METEFAKHMAYFTAQANANALKADPVADPFDDEDMYRWNGIGRGDFYIGTEDATIWSMKFGKTYADYHLDYTGTHGESIDSYVNDEERWSVELYELKFRDTNESIYAVERSDDTGRPVVTFYECPAEAQDAFDEECGEDMDGGRC